MPGSFPNEIFFANDDTVRCRSVICDLRSNRVCGDSVRADKDGSDIYESDSDDDCNGFIQSSFAKQTIKGNQMWNIVKSTHRNKQFTKESKAN